MEPNPLCTQLPVFDLSVFLSAPDKEAPEVQRLCAALAACLQQSSALVVRGEQAKAPFELSWGLSVHFPSSPPVHGPCIKAVGWLGAAVCGRAADNCIPHTYVRSTKPLPASRRPPGGHARQ